MKVVNLAKRPFLNGKPVVRLAALLWIFGAGLLAYNVWLYTRYLTGSASARAQLVEVGGELEKEENRLQRTEERLDRLDLYEQNSKAAYLNRLIGQRTFPWSQLFDDLEDVLPRRVRLLNLSPAVHEETFPLRRRRRRGDDEQPPPRVPREWIDFRFNAVAAEEEDMFVFVESLFESTVFLRPVLSSESLDSKTQELRFNLDVTYLPDRPQESLISEAGEAMEVAGVDGDPENGASSGLASADSNPERMAGLSTQTVEDEDSEDSAPIQGYVDRTQDPSPESGEPTELAESSLAVARPRSFDRSRSAVGRPTGSGIPTRTGAEGGTEASAAGRGTRTEVATVIAGTPLLPAAIPASTPPSSSGQERGSGTTPASGTTPPSSQPPASQPTEPGTAQPRPPADTGRAASGTPRLQKSGGGGR